MDLFNTQQKQPVLRLCEDRKIKKASIPIVGNFLSLEKELRAWFRFGMYYQKIEGIGNKLYLIIYERCALPVSPYELYTPKELKKMTDPDRVAGESLEYTQAHVEKKQRAGFFSDILSISIMGLVFAIIAIAFLVALGKFDPSQIKMFG